MKCEQLIWCLRVDVTREWIIKMAILFFKYFHMVGIEICYGRTGLDATLKDKENGKTNFWIFFSSRNCLELQMYKYQKKFCVLNYKRKTSNTQLQMCSLWTIWINGQKIWINSICSLNDTSNNQSLGSAETTLGGPNAFAPILCFCCFAQVSLDKQMF